MNFINEIHLTQGKVRIKISSILKNIYFKYK